MNLWIIAILTIGLIVLNRAKLPMIAWLLIWPVAIYAYVRFGLVVNVPASVLNIYLGITVLGLLAYVVADEDRYEVVRGQFFAFATEKQYAVALNCVVVLLPILIAGKVYLDNTVEVKAPTFGRTIHPAPPDTVSFKGKTIDMITAENLYRELEHSDHDAFEEHLENGKRVYFQNCVYCHGDDLRGDGIFAYGYNPVPANFNSATAIAMLQESYLFWRIAKGAPGLPDESGPWSSSMPAWEKFLTEEEIWDVILYLYDHTGFKPRAREEHH